MDELNNKKLKRKKSESISISPLSLNYINSWIGQIESSFKGLMKTNRVEVVNLLIELQGEDLPINLLEKMRSHKLSSIDQAKWIYDRLKEARKKGEEMSFEEAHQILKGLQKPRKKTRKKKTKPEANSEINNEP